MKMTTLERELLESMAGYRTHHANGRQISWGAWMSVCLENLEGSGLVRVNTKARTHTYEITDAGRAALTETGGGK